MQLSVGAEQPPPLKEAFTNVRLRRNFGFRKIAVRVFSEHRNVFWWRYSWFSINFESSGILDVCKITLPIPLEYHVISFEIPRGFSKILCGNENSDIQLISRTIWVMLNEWSLRTVHLKLGGNLEAGFRIYRLFYQLRPAHYVTLEDHRSKIRLGIDINPFL